MDRQEVDRYRGDDGYRDGNGRHSDADSAEDLYRLPPMEIKSFEEWKEEEEIEAVLDIPAPDYSDSESDDNEDSSHHDNINKAHHDNKTASEDSENNNEPEPQAKTTDPEPQAKPTDPEPQAKTTKTSDSVENEGEEESAFGQGLDYDKKKHMLQNKLRLLSQEEYENLVTSVETELDIPDPDYHEDEESSHSNGNPWSPKFKHTVLGRSKTADAGPVKNAQGLIEPKKLPNPVLDSREHQDLHREMIMNKKMGVDVLHRKPELQREMERRRDAIKKREKEEAERNKHPSFEKKLEEQAHKLKTVGDAKKSQPPGLSEKEKNEFLLIHSKISRTKSDS